MNSFQLGIVASLACYLAIGWYAGKRVRHLEDFFVAGRNAPTILILGTLVASFMSTNAFMGEAGMSYQGHAPLVIIMTCFNCLGYIVGAVFFGRYLRRSQALTVPAFFRARFNSRRIQMFAGISIVAGLSAYLLAVTWGMALIITEVTGFSEVAVIVLVWVSYTLFTLYSSPSPIITEAHPYVSHGMNTVRAAAANAGRRLHRIIAACAHTHTLIGPPYS